MDNEKKTESCSINCCLKTAFFRIKNFFFDDKEKKTNWKEEGKFLFIFVLFFSMFRFFAYDWYIVPSGSMVPTLLIGDMPFVEKWTYGYSKHSIWFSPNLFSGRVFFRNNVKRGEIIVFKHPKDINHPEYDDINIIKRVVGLPGDTIRVDNGVLSVNGVAAKMTPKGHMIYNDIHSKQILDLTLYEEILPLADVPVHTIAYLEDCKYSDANYFSATVVPEGHYFVMGDDRDCSKDSRTGLGFVPEENIMGRALFRIFSIDNGVRLWEFWEWIQNIRYSRIFTWIE